ncbi:MAG: IclR family transcriptional regulator [Aliishimia sp.]
MDLPPFLPIEEDTKDRNFVTALARGLDMLRSFQCGDKELSNTDFAERTGLPKATVSRLTYTLVKLGYLVVDPRKGTYRLGAGVLELGFGVLSSMDIDERADVELRALRDGPNSFITAAIGERHALQSVYIAVQRSREEIALSMRIGSRLPLFYSSVGRAILAGSDEAEREHLLSQAKTADPDGHEKRVASTDRAVSEYEAVGYCTGYGDWRPDVNAVAVPVFSVEGPRIYGMNVGGPTFHVKKKQLEKIYAPMLIEAAERLSIGHKPTG